MELGKHIQYCICCSCVCVCVRVLNICVLFTNYDLADFSCQIENFKGNRELRHFMDVIWLIDSNYDGLHRFWPFIALILHFIVVALFLIFNHVHLPLPLSLSLLPIDRLIASALRRNISLTHLDLERLEEKLKIVEDRNVSCLMIFVFWQCLGSSVSITPI